MMRERRALREDAAPADPRTDRGPAAGATRMFRGVPWAGGRVARRNFVVAIRCIRPRVFRKKFRGGRFPIFPPFTPTTWTVRGDEPRRRRDRETDRPLMNRGCDVDIPWRRAAATPRKLRPAGPVCAIETTEAPGDAGAPSSALATVQKYEKVHGARSGDNLARHLDVLDERIVGERPVAALAPRASAEARRGVGHDERGRYVREESHGAGHALDERSTKTAGFCFTATIIPRAQLSVVAGTL